MSPQIEVARSARGRVMAMNSAYDVGAENRGLDVVVNASYCGVLPARFVGKHLPRGAIGVDCAIGPAGASIAGLWYLEALNLPAAVADVMTVKLGDGIDLYQNGIVSFVNRPAADCGVKVGMRVSMAASLMLEVEPGHPDAAEVTNRTVVEDGPDGRRVVCTDSIAFGLPEDRVNVLVTAGHTGINAAYYLRKVAPFGFICSDGGMGREKSGIAGMLDVEKDGMAGATMMARTAPMGDGLGGYKVGVISAANRLALDAGVEVGMPVSKAAHLLLYRK